jgi:membrane associated rhomboid family serine protease
MGIHDRDYYREELPGFSIRMPQTAVGALIVVNIVIYIVDQLLMPDAPLGGKWLSDLMAIHSAPQLKIPMEIWQWPETLTHPWLWWQLLTYGFAHAQAPMHVAANMYGLWLLGRDIEAAYGRREFLRLYLMALFLGGLTWAGIGALQGLKGSLCYGASGAVTAIVILYALHFPHRKLLLFFVLPVPVWLCGVLLVAGDVLGAFGGQESQIAYSVHLGGAAFACLYYFLHWNLGRLTDLFPGKLNWRPRSKLRVHHPENDNEVNEDLASEVDRILEKIHQQGEASLTRKERRALEEASREYQKRRRDIDKDE